VVVTSAIARLPKGMAPLSLVVLVRDTGHSYVIAGLVAALLGLGDSVTTPWQGWLVDTYGRGRVLLPTAFLHVTAVS
jgi:MFS family permease